MNRQPKTISKQGKLALLLIFLLFSFSLHLHAQRYNFRTYTLEDGLVQSQVHGLTQDPDGSLWIGTYKGLDQALLQGWKNK